MNTERATRAVGLASRALAVCLVVGGLSGLAGQSSAAIGSVVRTQPTAGRFAPQSVTFVSLQTGWALGITPCAQKPGCLGLRQTTDGGRSWAAQSLPASLVVAADHQVDGVPAGSYPCCGAGLEVRFANLADGWIYGGLAIPGATDGSIRPTLWSTHNGGKTWREQHLPALSDHGSIFDLEAGAGWVYLMAPNTGTGVVVESSPVGRDDWHPATSLTLGDPAGGGEQSGEIVLQGSSGWLIEGNDRGTTGSARLASPGTWEPWTAPCSSVGHSFAVPAASNPSDLVAICVMGGFAYPLSPSARRGATIGSSWFYFSTDGGRSFVAGPELGPKQDFFDGVLASPTPAVILAERSAPNSNALVASFDGGRQWSTVYPGQLSYLGFTSSLQGVGIVSVGKTTLMIMTFDGGHHWSRVSF